jgi:NADH-quinone oxidoreductase subunit C
MTKVLAPDAVATFLRQAAPDVVESVTPFGVVVEHSKLVPACKALRDDPAHQMDYLVSITGVDYIEFFEVVYHLASITHNHMAVVKARAYGREHPSVPSVIGVWKGADLQEREVWDLMGVSFDGHPNLKRILTWEGFPGHPLRKDHLGG